MEGLGGMGGSEAADARALDAAQDKGTRLVQSCVAKASPAE
jgi:hypothetical protein